MSISEAEAQMVDQYSQNIDMQDIGLFWQLTIKTIDDLKIIGNENLTSFIPTIREQQYTYL